MNYEHLQHLCHLLCQLEKLLRRSHPWHFNPIEACQSQGYTGSESSPSLLTLADSRQRLYQVAILTALCFLFIMSKYARTNATYTLLKVPRKCSSTLILPFHSQGRFGSAIHHNSKSLFRLGRCNCVNTSGRMEVRKLRPYDVFLATPWVQMWQKNITSESRSTYEIGSLHYFPVSQTDCYNNRAPPCYLPLLLHLFLLRCKHTQ